MKIFNDFVKKPILKKPNEDLCIWGNDILDHYYKEPARSEVADDITKLKIEYHNLFGEFPDDRVMLALYKYGKSKRDKLEKGIDLALSDPRDLLVAAKFMNNIEAHKAWKAQLMQSIKNRKTNEKMKS